MPDRPADLTAVLLQLQTLLLDSRDIRVFLQQLTVLSTRVITTAEVSCGITMRVDGDLLTVASSDDRAERLDESQYRSHAGPCLESLSTGEEVSSPDLTTEDRWPDYTARARAEGLACSMSFPLATAGSTAAAMNVYGFDRPDLFGDTEREQYRLFAAQAAGALRLAIRQSSDARLLDQFEEALNSRSVIDQAIGILIGRHQLTAANAFELLRRESQSANRKLRDIATDLVTRTSGEPPAPGRSFETS